MSEIRDPLKYSADHEWVEIQDDVAIIGITDHAQSSLGDIVFIELPEEGSEVIVGEQFAVVESVKAASEVYSPISGEIIEVNADLEDALDTINESPYDDGWFVKVRLTAPKELDQLMSAEEYSDYLEGLS